MSVQPNEVVLSFSSHRSRGRSGVSNDPRCKAVYSFRRASHGGYYRMAKEVAETYTHRHKRIYGTINLGPIERIKGVSVLRGPYDDLRDCWSGD